MTQRKRIEKLEQKLPSKKEPLIIKITRNYVEPCNCEGNCECVVNKKTITKVIND